MLFVTSATLAVALILQPTMSNVSSTPTWKTLPVEQRLPPGFFGSIRDVDVALVRGDQLVDEIRKRAV